MSTFRYSIAGGDYEHAGAASRAIKEQLKRIGAAPEVIRRVMVAAYEAEMNVVIHSRGGSLCAALEDGRIDVEVVDDGPGIADVEQAMREGFSTAPARARELGFGAGMGLPNIRRSADEFRIDSAAGGPTRLRFSVALRCDSAGAGAGRSISLTKSDCVRCMACVRVCPTGAMRVRPSGPVVLEHLCVDCGACLEACPSGVLCVAEGLPLEQARGRTLVAPEALLAQFGGGSPPARVAAALGELGFADVRVTGEFAGALAKATAEYRRDAGSGPAISPACPAATALAEARFPGAVGRIAPFASVVEAALSAAGRDAVFVFACPAQRTVLVGAGARVMSPRTLMAALAPVLAGGAKGAAADGPAGHPSPSRDGSARVLSVSGIRHVAKALEEVENGQLGDVDVLDVMACDGGCFGSPLWAEDAFVSAGRWKRLGRQAALGRWPAKPAALRRGARRPRRGIRLDDDMAKAVEKLGRIAAMTRDLPGFNCGACGCPNCAALAEDVVLGRATAGLCARKPEARK